MQCSLLGTSYTLCISYTLPRELCMQVCVGKYPHNTHHQCNVFMLQGVLQYSVCREFVCKWATPRTSVDLANADYRAASPTPPYTLPTAPSSALNNTELHKKIFIACNIKHRLFPSTSPLRRCDTFSRARPWIMTSKRQSNKRI